MSLTPVPASSPRTSINSAALASSPKVTLDQKEAAMLKRFVAKAAEEEARSQQSNYSRGQVRWLTQTNDFNDYSRVKSQTEQFKACYWLSLLSLCVLLYLDIMAYLVQPSYNKHNNNNNIRNSFTGQIERPTQAESEYLIRNVLGALVRSTSNLYINTGLSVFCVCYLLPWTIMGSLSALDEYPQDAEYLPYIINIIWSALVMKGLSFVERLSVFPFFANSQVLLSHGETPSIFSFSVFHRVLYAIAVPSVIIYFMFYRRFVKFWKKKDIVFSPILVYAPIFGMVLVFCWWFIVTSALPERDTVDVNNAQTSTDAVLNFIRKDAFPILKEAFLPSEVLKANQLNPARKKIVDLSSTIYTLIVPYCVIFFTTSTLTHWMGASRRGRMVFVTMFYTVLLWFGFSLASESLSLAITTKYIGYLVSLIASIILARNVDRQTDVFDG